LIIVQERMCFHLELLSVTQFS